MKQALAIAIAAVQAAVGADASGDGYPDSGVTSLVECPNVNKRYQAVALLICDDLAEALGSTLQVMIGFAALYLLVEVLNRYSYVCAYIECRLMLNCSLLSDFGREGKKGVDGPLGASNKVGWVEHHLIQSTVLRTWL
jgi:hypothetical protein